MLLNQLLIVLNAHLIQNVKHSTYRNSLKSVSEQKNCNAKNESADQDHKKGERTLLIFRVLFWSSFCMMRVVGWLMFSSVEMMQSNSFTVTLLKNFSRTETRTNGFDSNWTDSVHTRPGIQIALCWKPVSAPSQTPGLLVEQVIRCLILSWMCQSYTKTPSNYTTVEVYSLFPLIFILGKSDTSRPRSLLWSASPNNSCLHWTDSLVF